MHNASEQVILNVLESKSVGIVIISIRYADVLIAHSFEDFETILIISYIEHIGLCGHHEIELMKIYENNYTNKILTFGD